MSRLDAIKARVYDARDNDSMMQCYIDNLWLTARVEALAGALHPFVDPQAQELVLDTIEPVLWRVYATADELAKASAAWTEVMAP